MRDHTKLICDIGEVSELFSDTDSLETFLQKIVELISSHMLSQVCSIYLYNEDTDELVLRATKGLKAEALGSVKLKLGEGLTGIALKELRPVCVKNASQSPGYRYFPGLGEEQYDSFLAVPIVRGTTRIGVVVIQNSQKNYFTEDDVKVFRAITSQLANTIETAKLLIRFNEKPLPAAATSAAVSTDLKFVRGRVGCEGFAYAPAIVYEPAAALDPALESGAVRLTLEDFQRAVAQTEEELKILQRQIEEKLSDVASLIFTAQMLMLKDQPFLDAITNLIAQGVNPPAAVRQVVNQFAAMFDALPNQYLRDKKHDVLDIGFRLLEHLVGTRDAQHDLKGKIVISLQLFPSDMLKFSSQGVAGVILLSGGVASHLTILATSLSLPVVFCEESGLLNLPSAARILLDAEQGNIFIDPPQDVVVSFQHKENDKISAAKLKGQMKKETRTADGTQVHLYANINLLGDLAAARDYQAQGVGLYRTEFPFMVRSNFPSEEEQLLIYTKLIEGMPGRQITFRTLDIGGDKVLSYYDNSNEENPFLGMRSIRFSLRHKDVFAQQVRAILRAGAGADIRIMFPMISSLDEFLQARDFVHQCVKELKKEKIKCHDHPSIGMMVELPSVLEIIDELAREADFFSIGTNDFIQYMLAVDRTNEKVADLYLPHHPAVLRALKRIVDAAQKEKIDVSVCGFMAHQEKFIPFLLGIGVRTLSVDARYLYKIQKTVEKILLADAVRETRAILSRGLISEIDEILR